MLQVLQETFVPDIYGEVAAPWWDDGPVAIVAGGPSLRGFDWDQLGDLQAKGCHILTVKGSIFDIPWADAGFGLDMPRFEEWRLRLAELPTRVYWAVPVEHAVVTSRPSDNMVFLKRIAGEAISTDPTMIFSGGTSGFGALQLAILKHAKRIVLFGFDYNPNVTGIHAHNKRNMSFRHNDSHYSKRRAQNVVNWRNWAGSFNAFRPFCERRGIEVINASEHSAITAFPRVSHDAAINKLREWTS